MCAFINIGVVGSRHKPDRWIPLTWAAHHDHSDALKMLITAKVHMSLYTISVITKVRYGDTYSGILIRRLSTPQLLIPKYVHFSKLCHRAVPLMSAHMRCLSGQANINAKDGTPDGRTALTTAGTCCIAVLTLTPVMIFKQPSRSSSAF